MNKKEIAEFVKSKRDAGMIYEEIATLLETMGVRTSRNTPYHRGQLSSILITAYPSYRTNETYLKKKVKVVVNKSVIQADDILEMSEAVLCSSLSNDHKRKLLKAVVGS